MEYSTLLLDLDHTLLDSAASERLAFHDALTAANVADPTAYFVAYTAINRQLWAAVERHEIGPDDVRVSRFEQLVDRAALDADAPFLANQFVAGLGRHGDLYPGVAAVLDELRDRAALALVTNGIGEVQRARIDRLQLEKYFDFIAISGELGTSKPGRKIFDITFEALGHPAKTGALMVGDSLSSDIQGGADYGIDTCWFNPGSRESNSSVRVSHEIHVLEEVLGLAPAQSVP